MRKKAISVLFALLLFSCATVATPSPISSPTNTPQAIPPPISTPTDTPQPTVTPILSTLSGILFFDMNANGLLDRASFKLLLGKDGKPPITIQMLFPEIVGNNGENLTVDEPGLEDFNVCGIVSGEQYCGITDLNGNFSISDIPVEPGTRINVKITDPNAENIQLAMVYINQWLNAVVVPAYELNGSRVPEQHLNDTKILPLSQSLNIEVGDPIAIGLMQGAFKGPFYAEDISEIYIWGYFDVLHSPEVCNEAGGINPDGVRASYDGRYKTDGSFDAVNPTIGVGDGHLGYDFRVPIGTKTINAGPTAFVMLAGTRNDGENYAILQYRLGSENLASYYGHLDLLLVEQGDTIFPGQLIGLTGQSGSSPYHQLHWDLATFVSNCTIYLPVFYSDVLGIDPRIAKRNDWTAYNLPCY